MAYLHTVHISVARPSFSCFCIQISEPKKKLRLMAILYPRGLWD